MLNISLQIVMGLLSVKSVKGKRDYMEDYYNYVHSYGCSVGMVCDGHGGKAVARETSTKLPPILLNIANNTTTLPNVLRAKHIFNAIYEWGQSMTAYKQEGSTLAGFVSYPDTVFMYNIGDSKICLHLDKKSLVTKYNNNNKNESYTTDFFCPPSHNTANKQENERVRVTGGTVYAGRLNNVLAVTRALGDADVGHGLSFVPDVWWVSKKYISKPVLLYTDGIYEFMNNPTIQQHHAIYNGAITDTAEILVGFAAKKGSEDNMTVMLVSL